MAAAALAFESFDRDRSGMLDFAEFQQLILGLTMVNEMGLAALPPAKLERMFQKADLNRDGRVDFNEFVAMRRKKLGESSSKKVGGERSAKGASLTSGARGREQHKRSQRGGRGDHGRSSFKKHTKEGAEGGGSAGGRRAGESGGGRKWRRWATTGATATQ